MLLRLLLFWLFLKLFLCATILYMPHPFFVLFCCCLWTISTIRCDLWHWRGLHQARCQHGPDERGHGRSCVRSFLSSRSCRTQREEERGGAGAPLREHGVRLCSEARRCGHCHERKDYWGERWYIRAYSRCSSAVQRRLFRHNPVLVQLPALRKAFLTQSMLMLWRMFHGGSTWWDPQIATCFMVM